MTTKQPSFIIVIASGTLSYYRHCERNEVERGNP